MGHRRSSLPVNAATAELHEALLGQGNKLQEESFSARWTPYLAPAFYIAVGLLQPLASELSKSALLTVCTEDTNGISCTRAPDGSESSDERLRVMPFFKLSLTLSSEFMSSVGCAFMALLTGGAAQRYSTLKSLLDLEALVALWPLGLVYSAGDFFQAAACNSASAPMVIVIGQCKLLAVAIFSRLLIKNRRSFQWCRLITISCAAAICAVATLGEAGSSLAQRVALHGSLLALLKAGLSSFGAVFSERVYKGKAEDIWLVSFRVQFMMLATSCAMMPLVGREILSQPSTFIRGGPQILCPEFNWCPPGVGGTCTCVDRTGWDGGTVLAAATICANGIVTGLILKHLSAVAKSVCSAVSMAFLYVACICIGVRPFCTVQALAIIIISVSIYEYAAKERSLALARKPRSLRSGEDQLASAA